MYEKIMTVGELIDYLSAHCKRDDGIAIYGDCDGGCGYHSASIVVNGENGEECVAEQSSSCSPIVALR